MTKTRARIEQAVGLFADRALKSKIALLWKQQERLDNEYRLHPNPRIKKALDKVNMDLYALGEI